MWHAVGEFVINDRSPQSAGTQNPPYRMASTIKSHPHTPAGPSFGEVQVCLAYLDGPAGLRAWQLSPYIQDDWRATKRLTVNARLRWDLISPYDEKHNHWANLDLATGQLLLAGQNGTSRSLVNFDLNTFGPRLGLAYSLDSKTVVCAGAGISYVFEDAIGAELYKNLPYYSNQVIATSTHTAPTKFLSQGLPPPRLPSV